MPNFYLTPTASFTVGQQTATGPKYMQTDMAGLNFTAIPYGVEGYTLISLAAPNAALAAESDVFAFPDDLTTTLSDADVTAPDSYGSTANIPTSFAVAGMAWADVLRQIAQVFLVAQSVSGANGGASIFANGATLNDAVQPTQQATLGQGAGNAAGVGSVGGSTPTPNALASSAGSVVGPFDLTDVDTSQSIGDTLLSVAVQFSEPIVFGGAAL